MGHAWAAADGGIEVHEACDGFGPVRVGFAIAGKAAVIDEPAQLSTDTTAVNGEARCAVLDEVLAVT